MRRLFAAAAALFLFAGIALADEFIAVITKVEGGKVTFHKMEGKGKKAKKGEEMTLPLSTDAKFNTGKAGKKGAVVVGEAIEGGARSETLTKIPETGRRARITTDDDNKKITGIVVIEGGKKKKADK